jgi:hypothetical protein
VDILDEIIDVMAMALIALSSASSAVANRGRTYSVTIRCPPDRLSHRRDSPVASTQTPPFVAPEPTSPAQLIVAGDRCLRLTDKRAMPRLTAIGCALFLAWRISAGADVSAEMDLAQVRQAATTAPGYFLNSDERVRVMETFLQLVQIKGPSGQEQLIREELRRLMTLVGAKEIPGPAGATNAPLNLVMEIPATGLLTNQPGLLLNAHIDTLARSNPERLAFDPVSDLSP